MRDLAVICEARTPDCDCRVIHRHHVLLRAHGGHKGPTLDVCLGCHLFIHANPAISYERGWLMHWWEAA